MHFLERLGLQALNLYINSVGCPNCRPVYRTKLQDYLREKLPELCGDCQSRFDRNPMRILDCKNEKCTSLSQGAPQMLDCLCDDCNNHFAKLKGLLSEAGINYNLNPRLVRGLDYYTKTAFEIQYSPLGAQSAVCGGGRYDGLVAECGGQNTPGIGFAVGIERVLLALENQKLLPQLDRGIDVYIAFMGTEAQLSAFKLLYDLRLNGVSADMDFMNRNIKGQMKQANKYPAKFVAIIGEDEVAQQKVMLKSMATGEQELVNRNEIIAKIQSQMEA